MKILFIHQNFPGQFKFLAPALVERGHHVTAMSMRKLDAKIWQGVHLVHYAAVRGSTQGAHPWVADFETKVIRGEACFRAALKMQAQGYVPDVIVAHPSWGESLFLKQVWPQCKIGIYAEFFYHAQGADVGFDPEFPVEDAGDACRIKLMNLNNQLHFDMADAGISPTHWQASTFPESFRKKITVVHDGIDANQLKPNPQIALQLSQHLKLTRQDEVITFVSRNLEPYRGYHQFMRALPQILKQRPNAHVLIVGSDGVSYGLPPKDGAKWKDVFANEIRPFMSAAQQQRVHFLGKLDYQSFIGILQLSSVHVYLTYPFVLSWSLLESMSVGGVIVASDTAPLHEVIQHDENGRLVDFFDTAALADEVCNLLQDETTRQRLSMNARLTVQNNYDLKTICLPKQIQWVESLLTSL
jgi:glycosyltransferase involved in cell wall biosynthesis